MAKEQKVAALPINDEQLETMIQGDQLIMVDFYAPWCAPCRNIAPMIDELAAEYAGKVKIHKLNIDENPRSTAAYGIKSIPTLVFFKQGVSIHSMPGNVPKTAIKSVLDTNMPHES